MLTTNRYDSPRAVSCFACSPLVSLWCVDRFTFRSIVAQYVQRQTRDLAMSIQKVELFQSLPESAVNRFVAAMTRVPWKAGQRIVQKGQEGKVFHIILQGRVKIHDIGLGDSHFDDQFYDAGDSFGERSLLTGEPRAANVTAVTDVITMAIDRATLEQHLGKLQSLLERGMRRKIIRSIPLFKNSSLTEPEMNQLADLVSEACYNQGAFLAEAGKPYQMRLWIIRHGSLFVFSRNSPDKVFKLKSGDYFGDKSIRGDPTHIASFTAVCEEDISCWVLTRDDIESVVGDINRLEEPPGFVKSRQGKPIALKQLRKHRILGVGGFGKVWLVSHIETKTPYALKLISKRKLIEQRQVQSSLREKDLLINLHHPFILNLVASFQDASHLYLLTPIICGGELYSQVEQRTLQYGTGLPNSDAAFYAACVIEALGYFHQRQIAYRDLKLENVLIDSDGYCIIVDLGFAKIITDQTFTFVGTPEYLAPEIIMAKGHDKAVDYWSFGVLVYELLVGNSPFALIRGSVSRMDMFKKIVLVDYTFPYDMNEYAKALISKLLVRRPSERLGNMAAGYLAVKKDQWFAEDVRIDFRQLIQKKIDAPWKPVVKNPLALDETFDSYRRQEYGIDFEKPLTKEEQALFAGF